MSQKFLMRDEASGAVTEKHSSDVGGDPAQAGQIPALDAGGRLALSMMPVGITPDTYVGPAGEALDAGNKVYINAAGEVRRASAAAAGVPCCGFVLDSVAANAQVMVYFEGRNTALTGLVPGSRYYLSDSTPGGVTATPVVAAAGKKHQYLGRAITATALAFEADDAIILA